MHINTNGRRRSPLLSLADGETLWPLRCGTGNKLQLKLFEQIFALQCFNVDEVEVCSKKYLMLLSFMVCHIRVRSRRSLPVNLAS